MQHDRRTNLQDKIEEARMRVKTAYDAMTAIKDTDSSSYEYAREKWLSRKRNLELLLIRIDFPTL